MRRGLWSLVLGVFLAALGAASAYAAGTTTTTTTTATTSTTTTSTTTTTPSTATTTTGTTTTTHAPGFARLTPSYLSTGCVGAGAAAIAEPGRPVLVLGTPASDRGPSAYPTQAPIVRFLYSTATGSDCTSAHVALGSVSLFGGAVTASSIEATHGKGTVSGFAIYGSPVALRPGGAVRIGGWGEVTRGKTVGRLTAPLVVQLLAAHHGLPAGTTIAFAFGASPQSLHEAKTAHHSAAGRAKNQARGAGGAERKERPPDFPAVPYPFLPSGVLSPAVRRNAVVSIAMRYLGVRYQWGGASPSTGFDCSGLVQYVFAQLGVPLVHFAASQWHAPDGVWVAPNRLQPGDLVFFTGSDGTRKAPGHVGIYVDDGYFIDAPHTGSFVRIDRLSEPRFANEFVGARRIEGVSLNRHLLHATDVDPSGAAFPLGFPQTLALEPLGASVGAAAASPPASAGSWAWPSAAWGGLLLVFATGLFLVRRTRVPATFPGSDPAD